MLLNLTPSGHELQRKMLLEHSSIIRTIFICSLVLLILVPLCVGLLFSKYSAELEDDFMCNVAKIEVYSADYLTGNSGISQGTAFLIANLDGSTDGYMLTARHVITQAVSEKVNLTFPYLSTDDDNELEATASIIWKTDVDWDGSDVNTLRYDVALLKLDDSVALPEYVSGFKLGETINVKQNVSIYGFPEGEEYAQDGQIASTSFKETDDLFILSFDIAPGMSGAPVYDEEAGEVLGIAIGHGNDLQRICISIKRILELMDQDGVKNLID